MNIHFSLRKQGLNPVIILQVFDSRFKGRKFMYSTGKTVEALTWDKRKERIKITVSKTKEANELNKHLDKLNQITIDYLSARHNNKTLNREDLKTHLEKSKLDEDKIKTLEIQKINNFFTLWKEIVETTKNKNGQNISPATKKSKLQTLNLVSKFCVLKNIKLTLEGIDMKFYHEFDLYMQGLNLNGNTRGKHFKDIKAILREADDRDLKVNPAYLKKSFKVIRQESDSTFLDQSEIKKLLNLKLNPAKEKIRDLFVMACFVGCRQSDWHQIKTENIENLQGKEILKIRQQKTGTTIHIPLHPIAKRILNKYKDQSIKVVSNQKINEALKEICKDEEAKLGKISINGKSTDKWKEITTHTARRSFATNAYLSKSLDVYQIMQCTGHKTESSFLKYLKLSGRDFATLAANSNFFNDIE